MSILDFIERFPISEMRMISIQENNNFNSHAECHP